MLALLLATMLLQDPQDAGAAPQAAPAPPAPPARVAPVPRPAPPPAPSPAPPPLPVEDERPRARESDVLRGDWSKPSGKRVTIEDQNSIDDTLQEIADAAGWNISLNTHRTGNRLLVLKLKNVPVEDALRATLRGTGLVATRTGDIVVVSPPDGDLPPSAPRKTLTGFDRPTGKKFSGDFEGTEIADALRQIAKAGGLSIVIPPGASGEVNGHFVDVPVEDVLGAVLAQSGLRAERKGTLVTVEEADTEFGLDVRVRGLPAEAREAIREAQRAAREAARDAAREARDALQLEHEDPDYGRDREVTGEDLVIAAGDSVRDVKVIRGNLTIQRGAVARDVFVFQGTMKIEGGAVVRKAVTVLGDIELQSGAVAREATAVGGSLQVAAGASIENDAVAVGGRVKADPDAMIGGSRQSVSAPNIFGILGNKVVEQISPVWVLVETLLRFVVLFVLGFLVLSLFPRRVEIVGNALLGNPVKTVLAGLLGWFASLLLLFLFAVTIIGIPLALAGAVAMVAAVILGLTSVIHLIGQHLPLPERATGLPVRLAIGAAAVAILTSIPYLGFAVSVTLALAIFGAVIRTRFGQPRQALPTTPMPPPVEA